MLSWEPETYVICNLCDHVSCKALPFLLNCDHWSITHYFLCALLFFAGFARLWGYPVGILANNGVLFSESALKVCCWSSGLLRIWF